MGLTLVTAPESEPIEVDEAKHQVSQDESIEADDDTFEGVWIPAARERCEGATERQLITATWDLLLPCFPCGPIELPRPPLQSVTSVKYIDTNGDLQTWASSNYHVDTPVGPKCKRGRILPVYGVTWPSTRSQFNAVQVRFVAGYGTAGTDVPARLRQAMLLDIGSMFVHRENVIIDPASEVVLELPDGSKSIYRSFRSRPRYSLPED